MPAFDWEIEEAIRDKIATHGHKWPYGVATEVHEGLGINRTRLLQFRLDALLKEIRES